MLKNTSKQTENNTFDDDYNYKELDNYKKEKILEISNKGPAFIT